jgi:hypothetical protein
VGDRASPDLIQHVPNASRQVPQGDRLLNELHVEIDAPLMNDSIA